MKKILPIILFLLVGAFTQSNSQIFTKFKASEGLSKATQTAKDSGMVNAELVAIFTAAGQYNTGQMNLSLEYDKSKGTSSAWIYVFRAPADTTKLRAFAVAKVFIFLSIELPLNQFGNIPITPEKPISGNWIDSDVLMSNLNKNSEYSGFLASHPNTQLAMLGLAVNTQNPLLDMNVSYWGGMFRDTSTSASITCFVQAVSGEVNCISFTGVEDKFDNGNLISVYPNPAADMAFVRISEVFADRLKSAAIYDINGNMVIDFTQNILKTGLGNISLPVGSLVPGTYFIKISTDNLTESAQLNIIK